MLQLSKKHHLISVVHASPAASLQGVAAKPIQLRKEQSKEVCPMVYLVC